jgi:amino acid transporter
VFSGILLGILLFVGFEAAASIGEESSQPDRSIPRGVLLTILISGLFYLLVAYAFSIGFGESAVEAGKWAGDPAYVDTMATRYVGAGLATVIDIVVILDAMGLALAICAVVARGSFALGRDGLLPSAFGKVSRRFGTPSLGNALVLVGAVGFVLLGAFSGFAHQFHLHPNELATFILLATIGSFVLEFIYLALAAGALWMLWRARVRAWWSYLIVLVAFAMPILAYKGALGPEPHDSSNLNWAAAFWALGIVGVAAVWFVALWLTRRAEVRGAARHAALHVGVPPLDETLDFQPPEPESRRGS